MSDEFKKRLSRRKFVTLAGGAVVASGILAACGDSTTAAPATTAASAATTAASAATTAASAATTAAGAATTAAGAATTAATSTTAAAAATTAAVKQNLTLTVVASQGWISDAEQAMAKKFEDQTGIHIDNQIIPADQYFSVLQTKLNSNQGPDIFMGQTGAGQLVTDYNVEKNAVDLSNEAWIKNEDPLSVNETTVNGKVYGLTLWDYKGGAFVIVYNKNIFKQQGLNVPKTYAEFKDIGQKLLAAKITPIYEPVADGWHHVLWFPELGPRWEENTPGLKDMLNNNKTTFAANKDALTTVQQMQEMYNLGFFGPNTLSDTNDKATEKLSNGSFAMYVGNLSFPAAVEKDFPNVKADTFGFFPRPLDDNQEITINPGGPTKFIYSGSKNIAAAKQYFNFLTQPDTMQYLLDNNPNFSSLNFNGVKDKFNSEQKNLFSAYSKTGVVYQASVKYVNAQWFDMGKDIVANWSGSIQPMDILKKVDQRRATAAKTAKDPAWQ